MAEDWHRQDANRVCAAPCFNISKVGWEIWRDAEMKESWVLCADLGLSSSAFGHAEQSGAWTASQGP